MYVFVGSTFAGLSFCTTQSFDKIDNKSINKYFDIYMELTSMKID